jgi:hypothetical protein
MDLVRGGCFLKGLEFILFGFLAPPIQAKQHKNHKHTRDYANDDAEFFA